jgi:hypothetical protein
MRSEGDRTKKAARRECTVLLGALRCLGASASLPGQSGESCQMAIYHGYWILSSHYTTTLQSHAIMASFSSVPLELLERILGMLDNSDKGN